MRSSDRLILASIAATALAMLTLIPITQDRSFLLWSVLVLLAVGLVTGLVRRSRLGEGAALVVELIAVVLALGGLAAVLSDSGGGPFAAVSSLAASGVEHLQTQSAPMQSAPGVVWLMVTAVSGALVLTDFLVSTLARPVWGIAPGMTLFLIPALALQSDLGVLSGLAVGLCYCIILVAEGINRTERWRRGVTDDPDHPTRPVGPVLWGSAALVVVPALVLSLVAWLAIPSGSANFLPGGRSDGSGGPLQLGDPTLDLRRNLNRPDDVAVLSYTTEAPPDGQDPDDGLYLRLASLPQFDQNGWQNSAIQVHPGQPGRIPGVGTEPGQRRTTRISIGNFDSEYLPLPYAPRSLEVPGDWGYDPQSLVYIATGQGRSMATRNLDYTVDSADLVPDGTRLSVAPAGSPGDVDITGTVPEDLPDEVVALAQRITEDASTDALKAAAIQAYLRGGTFEYSTEPAPGTGYDALTNFLFVDQRGYCEQFAAAMAVMARAIGIPSRVAIGFLPGEKDGDEWVVSTHDLHAWPELYFEGMGWVRWEPTPGNGTVPPSWTLARSGAADETTAPPSSAEPTDEDVPTELPSDEQTETGTDPSAASDDPNAEHIARWGTSQTVGSAIALVILVGLVLLPGGIRWQRRRHRLRDTGSPDEQVEAAWAEVRDTVIDARGTWPSGSPRAIGAQLGHGPVAGAEAAVAKLALLVERARYARGPAETGHEDLVALVSDIRQAVVEPASRGQRVRMALLPRSLWAGGRRAG